MGTKINTEYYGAENTWNNYTSYHASNVKYVANNKTIWNLKKNGVYTGGSLDMSASPWGIGESSLSSNFIGLNYRTADNRIKIMKNFSTKKNSPLLLFEGGAFHCASDWQAGETSPNSNLSQESIKQRLSPEIVCTETYPQTKSTLEIDENTEYQRMFAYEAQTITSWDYQKSRLLLDVVWWRNKTTGAVSHDWLARFVTEESYRTATQDIEILGVDMFLGWQYGTPGQQPSGNESDTALIPTIDGVEIDTPEIYKQIYYGDEVTKYTPFYKKLLTLGYWRISSRWSTSSIDSGSSLTSYTEYDEPKATPLFNTRAIMFGNISEKHQVFDDVSYHWEIRFAWNTSSNTGSSAINLVDGDIAPNNGYYMPYCALVIDDHIYDDIYQASYYALIHEACFLGLPVIANRFHYPYSIGENEWIFLPKFDEHLITTGEFVRSTASSASELVNYSWGNIFDDGMPEYDPDYQPPEPEPEEGDTGDLYNIGARRFFWNSLNVHLMSVANYDQFIQKLNALNMTDPDNETWQLQFKGLNPSDYIVGAYVSFVKPPKGTSSTIMLGPVDMQQSEYTYKETDTNAGFFSFGTKDILPKFYDFRDYAPYTMIEVYLPLCGTVEVDTAYFMGCSMKIDYYYDIFTMSCVACIYRVKEGQELLYKTVNGTIGAQIPMLSANMGAYQNQIKSIENALKQNELKLMTSTAALAAGVIAAPMTSGTSLIAAGTAAFSGAAGLANSIQKQSELEYQIEHIQPSISVTGAADPQTNLCTGQLMPKIIIKRAKMLTTYNQEEYAKTIGHACCINDILGYVEGDTEAPRTGLVVCSSVDTSGIMQMISESDYISPTADEVNMIKQALSSGVIL